MANRHLFFLLPVLLLCACASPAEKMSPAEVRQLSDDQLCRLQHGYAWEKKTELEIARRHLDCDPDVRTCVARGHSPATPAMALCVKDQKQKRELEEKLAAQKAEIERQRRENERLQQQMIIPRLP